MKGLTRNRMIGAAIAAAVLIAGVAGYAWWNGRGDGLEYRFGKVERGSITSAVSATGTVNPVVAVQVGSQVSGQIKELLADFNSEVKKDQVIAIINPDTFALRVNQALADVDAARATALSQRANVVALQAEASRAKVNLADAERELNRNKDLFEKNFVSAAALDKAQATYDAAREQLKAAQAQLAAGEAQVNNVQALVKQREAQLAQAKVDLERTTIRAPVDGVVIKKSVEPGQTVAASLQAPELFVIAQDLRKMQVDTSIDEAEVGRIREGQPVTFTVDSFPGRTFRGTVGQVRKAALVVQNVVTYTAVVETSNPNLELFPGMTASVRIVEASRDNVLKVPNAALRYRPAGAGAPASASGEGRAAGDQAAAAGGEEEPRKGKGKGGGGEALRERLTKELKLDADQQSKVETILNETRERIRGIATEDKGERRKQAERMRAESRARIAEVLTPEQRKRYEEMAPARGGRARATSGRVWVLDSSGKPQAISLRLGLTDGSYTEVLSGELKEGDQVILGTRSDGKGRQQKGGPRFGF